MGFLRFHGIGGRLMDWAGGEESGDVEAWRFSATRTITQATGFSRCSGGSKRNPGHAELKG